MTSSLVGSEMCIRDSGNPAIRPCASAPLRGSTASLHLQILVEMAHLLAPVSYTHLTLPTICSV
eukprot:10983798-Prorocentrum_lima.AAC.1